MTEQRPYYSLGEANRRRRQEKLAFLYLKCIFAIFGLGLLVLVIRILFLSTPAQSQQLIRPEVQTEINRRLDGRKLSRKTTVEITPSGYRFELGGKFYRL